jgi:hypothetical protein
LLVDAHQFLWHDSGAYAKSLLRRNSWTPPGL